VTDLSLRQLGVYKNLIYGKNIHDVMKS